MSFEPCPTSSTTSTAGRLAAGAEETNHLGVRWTRIRNSSSICPSYSIESHPRFVREHQYEDICCTDCHSATFPCSAHWRTPEHLVRQSKMLTRGTSYWTLNSTQSMACCRTSRSDVPSALPTQLWADLCGRSQKHQLRLKTSAKNAKTFSTLPGFKHWLFPLGPSGLSGLRLTDGKWNSAPLSRV